MGVSVFFTFLIEHTMYVEFVVLLRSDMNTLVSLLITVVYWMQSVMETFGECCVENVV